VAEYQGADSLGLVADGNASDAPVVVTESFLILIVYIKQVKNEG
jgi:hypothetical protein